MRTFLVLVPALASTLFPLAARAESPLIGTYALYAERAGECPASLAVGTARTPEGAFLTVNGAYFPTFGQTRKDASGNFRHGRFEHDECDECGFEGASMMYIGTGVYPVHTVRLRFSRADRFNLKFEESTLEPDERRTCIYRPD